MGTKMKGIRKGINKYISQMFVKEEEIKISGPTDVKHVAHIGWDSGTGSNPSWMDKFETGPNFAMTSVGTASTSQWTSQGLSQDTGDVGQQSKNPELLVKEAPSAQVASEPKKKRRKKKKKKSASVSSPRAGGVKSKSKKSKSKLIEGNSPLHIAMP